MYGTFRIRGLTLMLGHRSFSLRAMPVMVPPVPAPATNMSTLPGGFVDPGKRRNELRHIETMKKVSPSAKLPPHHHTAPGSPRRWCRSGPGGCWDCGTGPGCASWGSRFSDAKPRPRATRASRSERSWASGRSRHQGPSEHLPVYRHTHTLQNDQLSTSTPFQSRIFTLGRPIRHEYDVTFSMLIFSGMTMMQR